MKKLPIWLLLICTALFAVSLYTRAALATDADKLRDERLGIIADKATELRKAGVRGHYDKDADHVSGIPKFKHEEPYTRVRAKMLRAGWKPYHLKDADDVCMRGDTRCQGFPEMEACTKLGMPFCRFTWRKGKRVIGICTSGEYSVFDGIC